ncbi:dihydroceramidase [Mytilus galloprovincialis]|uniref:Alkaline ceramidase n=1 Tax=Mytilus galloprovincialis TaxID=29158 RepID=A0A8B6DZE7_MYTGA|nr:dihydroceramidase [Mytilus galloprovincialis]
MSDIFNDNGIATADDTIDFDTKSNELCNSFPCFANYFEIRLKNRLFNYVNQPFANMILTDSGQTITVYLLTKHVLFFQLSYGFVVVAMSVVCCNNFRKYREARNIFIVATVTYAFGFFLWEIDQNFCGGLKLWRSEVLGPFAPIFELHAWWHLLAGTGTYLSVLYSAYLRSLVLGNKPEIKYWKKVWPYIRITNGKALT